MSRNPLFPDEEPSSASEPAGAHDSHILPASSKKVIKPFSGYVENPAVKMIRDKIRNLYEQEPDAEEELAETKAAPKPLSKHQQFMNKLNNSGKSLSEIQTAWHNYYNDLSEHEKREVWQEFYANHSATSVYAKAAPEVKTHGPTATISYHQVRRKRYGKVTTADIKHDILSRVSMNGQLTVKHHLKSLAFGLATGAIVLIIFLFSFFNEVIIAPLIQPSRSQSSTPLIVNASGIPASAQPEVIIPKINVEIPVDYSQTSDDESVIESALNNGVVHYPSTVLPGQNGNAAFFGHSSNNIFNPGKYKFALVLLHKLVPGDTFYLTYSGKVYAYQVFSRKIVPPSDVGVLNDTLGKTATATLITCDPPGTSINRLVVTGEQISPAVDGNGQSSTTAVSTPTNLASNGPSLWSRLWHAIF